MPHDIHQYIWYLALIASSAFALWKGEAPERVVAVVLLTVGFLTGLVAYQPHVRSWQFGALKLAALVDGTLFAVALKSNRWWPLWAVSFQIWSTVALAVPPWDRLTGIVAAYIGGELWDYLTLAALAIGTHFEAQSHVASCKSDLQRWR